jgi:hypothetical protein
MDNQELNETIKLIVVLQNDSARIRLLGKGADEQACLADAYARAVQMYPLITEWEFLFWEPYNAES